MLHHAVVAPDLRLRKAELAVKVYVALGNIVRCDAEGKGSPRRHAWRVSGAVCAARGAWISIDTHFEGCDNLASEFMTPNNMVVR